MMLEQNYYYFKHFNRIAKWKNFLLIIYFQYIVSYNTNLSKSYTNK